MENTQTTPTQAGPETAPAPVAPEAAPEAAPAPAAPEAEGAAPESKPEDLTPAMQEAFSKRLGSAMAKAEADLRAKIEADYQQKLARLAPPPPPPEPVPEDAEALKQINEELWQEFSDNPLAAMEKAQRILGERKARQDAAEQAQWNWQAQVLAAKYADWESERDRMQQVLSEFPELVEKPHQLETLYRLTKRMQQNSASPDPASYLEDTGFLTQAQERLLQTPTARDALKAQFRDEIIQEYVSGKQQTAQQTPPLMGGGTAGSSPSMPPNIPKTWDEAKRAAFARLGGS